MLFDKRKSLFFFSIFGEYSCLFVHFYSLTVREEAFNLAVFGYLWFCWLKAVNVTEIISLWVILVQYVYLWKCHAVLVLALRDEHTMFWVFVGTEGRHWFWGAAAKSPKRPQRSRQRRLSPDATTSHSSSSPPSSEGGGWRPQPAGGGPAWRPVGVPVHPGAAGWSGYWWLKRRLRPCRRDGTLTRRLGRQELASHMSRSKVKHTIMGAASRADGLWCFLHD